MTDSVAIKLLYDEQRRTDYTQASTATRAPHSYFLEGDSPPLCLKCGLVQTVECILLSCSGNALIHPIVFTKVQFSTVFSKIYSMKGLVL